MPSSCKDCLYIYTLWAFEAIARANIIGFVSSLPQVELWHKFHRRKAVKQAEQAFKVAMQPSKWKSHKKSFCAMSQLLNKMKDFVKSVKYYLRYANKGTMSEMNLQENLVASECDSSVVLSRKNTRCLCVHIIMIVSL